MSASEDDEHCITKIEGDSTLSWRDFLERHPLGTVAEMDFCTTIEHMELLYEAGAREVYLCGVVPGSFSHGQTKDEAFCSELVIELPEESDRRRAVYAAADRIPTHTAERLAPDRGQRYLYVWFD